MYTKIEHPWGVTAFGSASVRAAPDTAHVRLAVDRLEQSPDAAFSAAREGISGLREALRRHGVADEAVSSSRLGLSTEWSGFGSDRQFHGHRCQAGFSVRLTDLDALEQLLVDAVEAGANRVDGVTFDVLDKPGLRARARRDAVAAAQRKAELYAEAAGTRLGPVVHIEDVDPERLTPYRGHSVDAADPTEAELAPGQVVVSAAVMLGFSLSACVQ